VLSIPKAVFCTIQKSSELTTTQNNSEKTHINQYDATWPISLR